MTLKSPLLKFKLIAATLILLIPILTMFLLTWYYSVHSQEGSYIPVSEFVNTYSSEDDLYDAYIDLESFDPLSDVAKMHFMVATPESGGNEQSISAQQLLNIRTLNEAVGVGPYDRDKKQIIYPPRVVFDIDWSIKAVRKGGYPFDKWNIYFELFVEHTQVSSSEEISYRVIPINPILRFDKEDYWANPEYRLKSVETGFGFVDCRTCDSKANKKINASIISLEFARPISTQIIVTLLMLFIFMFSVSILALSDASSVLEASIALLLGIWSIREVILSDKITPEQSFGISQMILIGYVVLGLSLTAWVMFRLIENLQKKSGLDNVDQIEDENANLEHTSINHETSLEKLTIKSDSIPEFRSRLESSASRNILFSIVAITIAWYIYHKKRTKK